MAEIFEAHPELYHYTDFAGLRGIIESQALWATHYSSLNDESEVKHLRSRLREIAFRVANDELRQMPFSSKRQLKQYGGLAAYSNRLADDLVNVFYQTTFENMVGAGPFADPYIVSFCAHTKDDTYVQNHGLLSQWRAYGQRGGFALVLDTKDVLTTLESENERYHYTHLALSDVVYDHQDEMFEEEFAGLVPSLRKFISDSIIEDKDSTDVDIFTPFFGAVTRYKHRAFVEEREVRLVAAPASDAIFKRTMASGRISADIKTKKIKPVHSRYKVGEPVRYVVINECSDTNRLPIKRIVVGPQKNQSELQTEVEELVKHLGIKVTCSETPYVSR